MGKGGGCVPSKKKAPPLTSNLPQSSFREIAAPPKNSNSDSEKLNPNLENLNVQSGVKLKLFIVFYSMYGHVEALAKRIKKGVEVVEGVEGYLFRVPETFSDDVLKKMQSPPKNPNIPVISAPELVDADGFLFGFPTRYGSMAAQMSAFFDSTGKLWTEQALSGKPAGFFVSTGTQGGGQETTAWTAITQLAHHGMMFVPIGYTFGSGMFRMDAIRGGTPYGAGVFAGDGKREASDMELAFAEHQGTYMASILKRLHNK